MENRHTYSVVNDALLALIVRFVGGNHDIKLCDNAFVQQQINDIQAYIKQFPTEEQNYQALVWIERYAKTYRERWENEMIARELQQKKCDDCPLTNRSEYACQIHQEWLDLLQQYIEKKIGSQQYVEETLQLLEEHKRLLKWRTSA